MAGKMSTFTKKRIFADVRELKEDASHEYIAEPLEDNLFEWHFTIRGPKGTDFEGGLYHGRILLPTDYPFKPPNIVFLTPNGRFEAGKKICLSISAHHPEEWQAAWGIRLILEALISFLPTEGGGAVGALDWSSIERKRLAKASTCFCCEKCGLISNLLPNIIQKEENNSKNDGAEEFEEDDQQKNKSNTVSKYADAIAQLHCHVPISPLQTPQKNEIENEIEKLTLNQKENDENDENIINKSLKDQSPTTSNLGSCDEPLTPLKQPYLQRMSSPIAPSPTWSPSPATPNPPTSNDDDALLNDMTTDTTPQATHSIPSLNQRRRPTTQRTNTQPPIRNQVPVVEQGVDGLLIIAWILGLAISFLVFKKICRMFGIDELSPF